MTRTFAADLIRSPLRAEKYGVNAGNADNSAAFSACFSDLPSAGGDVKMPEGILDVGTMVDLPVGKPILLTGRGMRSTKVRRKSGVNLTAVMRYAGVVPTFYTDPQYFDYLTLADFEIDGQKGGGLSGHGLLLQFADYFVIDRLSVVSAKLCGIRMEDCDEGTVTASFMTNNGTTIAMDAGLYLNGGSHDVTMTNLGIETNVGSGIFMAGGFESQLTNINCWNNDYDIRMGSAAHDNVVVGGILDTSRLMSVFIEGASTNIVVASTVVVAPGGDAVRLADSTNCDITVRVTGAGTSNALVETGSSNNNTVRMRAGTRPVTLIGTGSVNASAPRVVGQAVAAAGAAVGRYIAPPGTIGSATHANGTMRAVPIDIDRPCTIDRIGVNITTTAGSAGALIRFGLYSSDANGDPATLILDGGTVDATTVGAKEVVVSQAVRPGRYWLTDTTQGLPATAPLIDTISSPYYPFSFLVAPGGATHGGYLLTQTATGALPSAVTVSSGSGSPPRCYVRVAA